MSRIEVCFADAAIEKRKVIIPYIMAGDPSLEQTLALMHALVDVGADIIELGMPFSDPMADGPTIQAASERVLANGTRLPQVFEIVKSFRTENQKTPVVLMGYANPMAVMGIESFALKAAESGVDGVITVDMPPEESKELAVAFANHQLDPIFLLSPTTPEYRVQSVCEQGSGFIYYVSLKGITGSSRLDIDDVAKKVVQIKLLTSMPVAVGFGISDAQSAAAVAKHSDAVVVGSAIVKRIANNTENPEIMISEVCNLVRDIRNTVDCI